MRHLRQVNLDAYIIALISFSSAADFDKLGKFEADGVSRGRSRARRARRELGNLRAKIVHN